MTFHITKLQQLPALGRTTQLWLSNLDETTERKLIRKGIAFSVLVPPQQG